MKTLINITAQYQENYAHYNGGQHWKNKGTTIFQVKVNDGCLMFDNDTVVIAIKKILLNECNALCRYTYISHEAIYSTPVIIEDKVFDKAYLQAAEEREEREEKELIEGDYPEYQDPANHWDR